jgi:hypothetical protein
MGEQVRTQDQALRARYEGSGDQADAV